MTYRLKDLIRGGINFNLRLGIIRIGLYITPENNNFVEKGVYGQIIAIYLPTIEP